MAVDAAEPTEVVLVQHDVRLSQMTWLTAETAKAAEPAIEVKCKANVWNMRSKSTTLSALRVISTKHVVGYRGVLIFISQLALFPTFSIVSSHLDKLGEDPNFTVDPVMKSVAASIGPLGLCLVASLLEKLDKTARESAAAQMANVCGILACTLGLLFDQLPEAVRANPAAVWTGIMFLTGLSDISPFINKARACYTLLTTRDTAPALPIDALHSLSSHAHRPLLSRADVRSQRRVQGARSDLGRLLPGLRHVRHRRSSPPRRRAARHGWHAARPQLRADPAGRVRRAARCVYARAAPNTAPVPALCAPGAPHAVRQPAS